MSLLGVFDEGGFFAFPLNIKGSVVVLKVGTEIA